MDKASRIFQYIITVTAGETVKAYVPHNLPPVPPPEFSESLLNLMETTNQALGRLDGASLMLPNMDLFTYMFLKKHVMPCMGALKKFLHNDPVSTSPLTKAALAHVQFETIHPFLDGNGRVGRLLITLILYTESVLHMPSLYLSLYFALLKKAKLDGNWEEWIAFFLTAIKETSKQAVKSIVTIQELFTQNENKLLKLGRIFTYEHYIKLLSEGAYPIIRPT